MAEEAAAVFGVSGGVVDLAAGLVRRPEGAVALTAHEVALLRRLARTPGHPVARDALAVDALGWRPGLETRAVDAAVTRLRKKVERDPKAPSSLVRAHGVGYRLVVSAPEAAAPARDAGPALLGRAAELGWLLAALRPGATALVWGTAGVGKTTLARAVSASFDARAPGRNLVVPLPELPGRAPVLRAIADALGVRLHEEPAAASERLARAARTRASIVLDRADHDVRSALAVAAELARPEGPAWLVVARSRAPGVAVPELHLEPLSLADAAALYRQRAGSRRGAAIADAEADVEALVARVDRVPLAIELAAARAAVLPAKALLARLDRRFDWLTPAGELPGLSVAIAASWELLDAHQRDVLAAVSAFADAFTVEDASALTGADPSDALGALFDAALAQAAPGGLRLYDNVREWVRQTAAAPSQEARRRLGLHLAGQARALRHAPSLGAWSAAHRADLEAALSDVDAAPEVTANAAYALVADRTAWLLRESSTFTRGIAAARASGDADAEAQLRSRRTTQLLLAGDAAGAEAEVAALEALVPADAPPDLRAQLAHARGRHLKANGAAEAAVAALREAAALWDEAQRPSAVALARIDLATGLRRAGRFDEARGVLEAAIVAGRRSHDDRLLGVALHALATVRTSQGATGDARALLEEARAAMTRADDRVNLAVCLSSLANNAWLAGEPERALACYSEALALHVAQGSRAGEAWTLANRAAAHLHFGATCAARLDLVEALALHRATGERAGEAFCLRRLGEVALEESALDLAIANLEAAIALHAGELVDGPARTLLARALAVAGRVDEARSVAAAVDASSAPVARMQAFAEAHIAHASRGEAAAELAVVLARTGAPSLAALDDDPTHRLHARALARALGG